MKYLVKFIVVTFFLINCTYSFAEQKIVILDLKYALNQSKAGKAAQDFLKQSFNNTVKKYTDMEKDLKKEETDLLANKNVLQEDDFKKKINELRKKVISFQSEKRSALDKIATQRAKAKDTLIKKIDPILNKYIKENNISLVVDKSNTLGGNPENDITEIIVDQLNKELPSLNLK